MTWPTWMIEEISWLPALPRRRRSTIFSAGAGSLHSEPHCPEGSVPGRIPAIPRRFHAGRGQSDIPAERRSDLFVFLRTPRFGMPPGRFPGPAPTRPSGSWARIGISPRNPRGI
ncbi:MAG: hypothetical protein MZV64_09660 [Ignavibacteriales bacterium]|nr:hypothetical protein [Ignavibacteriales bacterium]